MRCLLIGDGQFLDTLVAKELLLAGWEVALLDEKSPTEEIAEEVVHIRGSVENVTEKKEEIQSFNPETVIHLSARNAKDIDDLCKLCDQRATNYVISSSSNVYKANAIVYQTEPGNVDNGSIGETALLREKLLGTEIDSDRLAMEKRIAKTSVPTTLLRLPPVYGPGDHLYRLSPLIARMLDNRPFIVVSEKQADWKWTHGYSGDVAHGIALAALKPKDFDRVFNLGESKTPTIMERISHLATVFGWDGHLVALPDSDLPPHIVPEGNFDQNIELDTSKIRSELGFKEVVDYYDGLYEAIEWYRENLSPNYKGKVFDYRSEDALRPLVEKTVNGL